MDVKNRRSSLRKSLFLRGDDNPEFSTPHFKRRISFSGKHLVREFNREEEPKAWDNSYEISDHVKVEESSLKILVENEDIPIQIQPAIPLDLIGEINRSTLAELKHNDNAFSNTRDLINMTYQQDDLRLQNSVDVSLFDKENQDVHVTNERINSYTLDENEPHGFSEFSSTKVGEKTSDFMQDIASKTSESDNKKKEKENKMDTNGSATDYVISDLISEEKTIERSGPGTKAQSNCNDCYTFKSDVNMTNSCVMKLVSNTEHLNVRSIIQNKIHSSKEELDKIVRKDYSYDVIQTKLTPKYKNRELEFNRTINTRHIEKRSVQSEDNYRKTVISAIKLSPQISDRTMFSELKTSNMHKPKVLITKICTPKPKNCKKENFEINATKEKSVATKTQHQNVSIHEKSLSFSLNSIKNISLSLDSFSQMIPTEYKTYNFKQLNDEIEQGNIEIFPKTPLTNRKAKEEHQFAKKGMNLPTQRRTLVFENDISTSPENLLKNKSTPTNEDFSDYYVSRAYKKNSKPFSRFRFSHSDNMMLNNTIFLATAKLDDETIDEILTQPQTITNKNVIQCNTHNEAHISVNNTRARIKSYEIDKVIESSENERRKTIHLNEDIEVSDDDNTPSRAIKTDISTETNSLLMSEKAERSTFQSNDKIDLKLQYALDYESEKNGLCKQITDKQKVGYCQKAFENAENEKRERDVISNMIAKNCNSLQNEDSKCHLQTSLRKTIFSECDDMETGLATITYDYCPTVEIENRGLKNDEILLECSERGAGSNNLSKTKDNILERSFNGTIFFNESIQEFTTSSNKKEILNHCSAYKATVNAKNENYVESHIVDASTSSTIKPGDADMYVREVEVDSLEDLIPSGEILDPLPVSLQNPDLCSNKSIRRTLYFNKEIGEMEICQYNSRYNGKSDSSIQDLNILKCLPTDANLNNILEANVVNVELNQKCLEKEDHNATLRHKKNMALITPRKSLDEFLKYEKYAEGNGQFVNLKYTEHQNATNVQKSWKRLPVSITPVFPVAKKKHFSAAPDCRISLHSTSPNSILNATDSEDKYGISLFENKTESIQEVRKNSRRDKTTYSTVLKDTVNALVFEDDPITISDVSVYFQDKKKGVSQNLVINPIDVKCNSFHKRYINLTCDSPLENIDQTRLSLVRTISDDDESKSECNIEEISYGISCSPSLEACYNATIPKTTPSISKTTTHLGSIRTVKHLLSESPNCGKCQLYNATEVHETVSLTTNSFSLPSIPSAITLDINGLRLLRLRPHISDVLCQSSSLNRTIIKQHKITDEKTICGNDLGKTTENRIIEDYENDMQRFLLDFIDSKSTYLHLFEKSLDCNSNTALRTNRKYSSQESCKFCE